ncbi:MAG: hypothetical protein DRO88_04055 [Promethearchaeia archaeon]|nr:MAG: hypothetical protein DRO88_04055 [Candidatus Lokiarchaeia archaeon]
MTLDFLKKLKLKFFSVFANHKKSELEDPLEFPIQQETFLEELRKFQKQCFILENSFTSYSSLSHDMENLGQYHSILKQFKRIIKRRMREIRKVMKRYRSFLSSQSPFYHNYFPALYFSNSKGKEL